MRCPICKRNVTLEGNSFRPFCSERCRLIDLDNWLSARYRITPPLPQREADSSSGGRSGPASATEGGEAAGQQDAALGN